MKNSWLLLLFVCLFLATSCGKSIVEESEKDDTEQPVTPPDDGGDDDDGGSGGSDDGGSGGSDDGGSGGGSDDGGSGGESGGGSGDGGSGEGGSGGGSDDGGSGGIQTEDIVSVKQFIEAQSLPLVKVKGYIVGDCTTSFSHADFEPPFSQPQAILLADDPNERAKENIIAIRLPSGSRFRTQLNLVDHKELWHKRVLIPGYRDTYLGMVGIKDIAGICKVLDE